MACHRVPAVALLAVAALGAMAGAAPPELRPATPADILRAVRTPGARAVIVNVWASWCLPCREELPDLLRLRLDYSARGVRVILVSADFASDAGEAARLLAELGVDFPTYRKQGSDMELIDALDPAWSGALPATFIYDGRGERRQTVHGKATYAQLVEQVRAVLAVGAGVEGSLEQGGGRPAGTDAAR